MPIKAMLANIPFRYYPETGVYLARTKNLKALVHLEKKTWTCSLVVRLNGVEVIRQGRGTYPGDAVTRAQKEPRQKALPKINA